MGLAVSTHLLADLIEHDPEGTGWLRDQLEIVNALLAEAGLPSHVEPETHGTSKARQHISSFPYSFLHYLRRAYAHVHENQPLTPVADGENAAHDPVVADASSNFDTHLLCHSDAEGFYVPIDFRDVIFDSGSGLAGGMLGSSVQLMAELAEVAPALGIRLADGALTDPALTDDVAAAIAADDESSTPFYFERLVWLTLFEAARCSIADGTMIVFN